MDPLSSGWLKNDTAWASATNIALFDGRLDTSKPLDLDGIVVNFARPVTLSSIRCVWLVLAGADSIGANSC